MQLVNMNTLNSTLNILKNDPEFVNNEQELCLERFTKFLLKCYEVHSGEIFVDSTSKCVDNGVKYNKKNKDNPHKKSGINL